MNLTDRRIKKTSKSFLFKITGRTVLFLSLMMLFLFVFYVSGTYQGFLDSTQLFVLFLCSAASLGAVLFALAGAVQSIMQFLISRKKSFWIYFFFYVLDGSVSAVIFLFVRTVSIVSKGI